MTRASVWSWTPATSPPGSSVRSPPGARRNCTPYDPDRAYRRLRRYLGDDPEAWDRERFSLEAEEGDRFACLRPARLEAIDLSYRPASR